MIFQYLSTHHGQTIRKANPYCANYQKLTVCISVFVACFWLATSTLDAKIVSGGGEIYTMNSDLTQYGLHMTRHLLDHRVGLLTADRLLSIAHEAVKWRSITIFG